MENPIQILAAFCVLMSPPGNQVPFVIDGRPPGGELYRFCQHVVSVLSDSYQSTSILGYFEHSIPGINAEATDVLSHNIRSVIVIPR